MRGDFLEREMRTIDELEGCYRWAAELVKPSELQEDLLPAVRGYMSVLRGVERCVELRLKLVREAGRLPEPEPDEPVATVDLSRLSDGALREVEQAMVPAVSSERAEATDERQVPAGEREGERDKEDDRKGSCEKRIYAAVAPPKDTGTAKAVPQAGTTDVLQAETAKAVPQAGTMDVLQAGTAKAVPKAGTMDIPQAGTAKAVSQAGTMDIPQGGTTGVPQGETAKAVPKAGTMDIPQGGTTDIPQAGATGGPGTRPRVGRKNKSPSSG